MKNKVFHSFISLITLLLAALFILSLSACYVPVEDVIPKKLGKAEGLWLYHENTRALSDRTQKTELLTSVTIEDTQYGAEEFKIIRTEYATDVKEIFYVLTVGEGVYAYHYNYKTHQSGYLCTLNSSKTEILVSESYILFTSQKDGVLFNHDLTIISDELNGFNMPSFDYIKLSSGSNYPYKFLCYYCNFPYKMESGNNRMNFYYFDGEDLNVLEELNDSSIFISGNYVYFLNDGFSLNAATNEKNQIEKYDKLQYPNYDNGTFYGLVSRVCASRYYEYKLVSLHDGKLELLYDFGEITSAIEMNGLKIKVTGVKTRYDKYYKLDTKTGKLVSIKESEYHKTEEKHYHTIEVDEYTFYVTTKNYEGGIGIGALNPTKTCWYLNRKKGNKTEIMQYLLEDAITEGTGSRYFYDDICDF